MVARIHHAPKGQPSIHSKGAVQAQRIPYRFEVGDQWLGLATQTDDIVQLAKDGYLFFILYTSGGGSGHRVRVKVRETQAVES